MSECFILCVNIINVTFWYIRILPNEEWRSGGEMNDIVWCEYERMMTAVSKRYSRMACVLPQLLHLKWRTRRLYVWLSNFKYLVWYACFMNVTCALQEQFNRWKRISSIILSWSICEKGLLFLFLVSDIFSNLIKMLMQYMDSCILLFAIFLFNDIVYKDIYALFRHTE